MSKDITIDVFLPFLMSPRVTLIRVPWAVPSRQNARRTRPSQSFGNWEGQTQPGGQLVAIQQGQVGDPTRLNRLSGAVTVAAFRPSSRLFA